PKTRRPAAPQPRALWRLTTCVPRGGAVLRRQGLSAEVKLEHAAVHLVHVDEPAGDVHLVVPGVSDAGDGHPAGPLTLGADLFAAVVDERADAGVVGKLEADPNLMIGADINLARADPHAAGRDVHDPTEHGRVLLAGVDALHLDGLLLE